MRGQWLPEAGPGAGDEQTEHRGFLGQWECAVRYYKDGPMSESMHCTAPRVKPKVNDGFWVILMCWGGSPSQVDDGGGCACVGNRCAFLSALLRAGNCSEKVFNN